MAKIDESKAPRDAEGNVMPFTMIPDAIIRSRKLDVYEKAVFCLIASYKPAFPSYEAIIEGTGLSRERVWKSLCSLEKRFLIYRRKRGRGVEYFVFWDVLQNEELKRDCLKFGEQMRSPDELMGLVNKFLKPVDKAPTYPHNRSPHELMSDQTSSPGEL